MPYQRALIQIDTGRRQLLRPVRRLSIRVLVAVAVAIGVSVGVWGMR